MVQLVTSTPRIPHAFWPPHLQDLASLVEDE